MEVLDIRTTNWKGEVCYLHNNKNCVQIRHESTHSIKKIKETLKGYGYEITGYTINYGTPTKFLSMMSGKNKMYQALTRKILTQSELDFTE